MTEAEKDRLTASFDRLMAACAERQCPPVDISITDGGERYVLTIGKVFIDEFESVEMALCRAAEELAARGEST